MRALHRGRALILSERGSTAAEYGLILALIVAALVLALTTLSGAIATAIDAVGATISP